MKNKIKKFKKTNQANSQKLKKISFEIVNCRNYN